MSAHGMRVLIIEDDPDMQVSLARTLRRRGVEVEVCSDGQAGLERWKATKPDAVVLDLTLPNLDGLNVLYRARRTGLITAVLVVTARATIGDRILGLDAGADDYLPKPFDLDEFEARLRALYRRSRGLAGESEHAREFGGLRLDRESGAVYSEGVMLQLHQREAALLQALLVRPGRLVPRERAFERVFPSGSDINNEALEVVVYRLRKKLVNTQVQIVTLRGLGYVLKAA